MNNSLVKSLPSVEEVVIRELQRFVRVGLDVSHLTENMHISHPQLLFLYVRDVLNADHKRLYQFFDIFFL